MNSEAEPQSTNESNANSGVLSSASVSTPGVHAISLASRIPPFWREKPVLWFIQFEAVTLKFSEEDRYNLVLPQLQREELNQISDILLQPPASLKYTTIKERLISVYEPSQAQQLQQLLSSENWGESKPSILLRCIQELAVVNKLPDNVIRNLWVTKLSPMTQAICRANESLSLAALAKIADAVDESTASYNVAAVDTADTARISSLEEQVKSLKLQLENLSQAPRTSRFQTPLRRDRTPPPNRRLSPTARVHSWCYYHQRFANRARQCRQPCSFTPGQGNDSQH